MPKRYAALTTGESIEALLVDFSDRDITRAISSQFLIRELVVTAKYSEN
jgi:hypothetical protein